MLRRWLLSVCVLCFGSISASCVCANELKGHPSPYLALHGDDPVHWREWNAGALRQAREQGKLVFVSIGYFACHWCHVMQQESFADPKVAAVLNQHFISVKVDRELNPALDHRLMTFVQATAGRGGWPLNVFLTPDGYPLAGVVYRPRDSFIQLLGNLQKHWTEDSADLHAAAIEVDAIMAGEVLAGQDVLSRFPAKELKVGFRRDAMTAADTLQGGFSGQTRFPTLPQMQALLAFNAQTPKEDELDFLRLTIDQMLNQGLRDHIGDGFFRYTVDPDWETPHYEKMLYTNAQMVTFLIKAAEVFKQPRYEQAALATVDFLLREMRVSDGSFIASLSAVDSENREGGYYLWSQAELKSLLSQDELVLVNQHWRMARVDTGEGVLPLFDPDGLSSQAEAKLSEIKRRLIEARERKRGLPKDDKRLAGLNGLVLTALSKAVSVRPDLRKTGDQLARFLMDKTWNGHALNKGLGADGQILGNGELADYGYVAEGLWRWGKVTKQPPIKDVGVAIAKAAEKRFATGAGWKLIEQSLLPNESIQLHLPESTLPSPEVAVLRVLGRSAKPEVTVDVRDNPFQYPSLVVYWSRKMTGAP